MADIWTTETYQNAASFVPKLAGRILEWLDVQKDDVILDVGCGDGVLDLQMGHVLAQGSGSVHGVDSSPAMIEAAQKATATAGLKNCTFQGMFFSCPPFGRRPPSPPSVAVPFSPLSSLGPRLTHPVLDANRLVDCPSLQQARFSKAFSNAAMHWILRPADQREHFFRGVRDALQPGALFAFEMGGLGNITELLTGILASVRARIGMAAAVAANPWFFPDEAWATDMLEQRVGGWRVERAERVWRPTPADAGGVDAWIRLMARPFLDAVPDPAEREACTREIVELLEYTTRQPGGTFNLNYVRLRVLARKL